METRHVLSLVPGKNEGVVFVQRRNRGGPWHNLQARAATPQELAQRKAMPEADDPSQAVEMENAEEPAVSGSHNQHARLAPSASKQWAGCLASLPFIEANRHRIPEDKGSVYAQEGTDAHDWAAKVFLKQCSIEEVPENFRPYIQDYVEHCMDGLVKGDQVFVEVQVPLFYQTSERGTCDFAAVAKDGGRVVIRDLKYGAGVLVKSLENTQLAIYGLSLLRWLETKHGKEFSPDMEVDIAVYQPRHHEGADQPAWKLTYADLEMFGADLENKAKRAHRGVETVREWMRDGERESDDHSCMEIEEVTGLKFAPGEGDHGACRWCPAKGFCERRLDAIAGSLPDKDPARLISAMPDLTKEEAKQPVEDRLAIRGPLDDEFLVEVLRCAPALKKYLEDVREYLEARVLNGDHVPGTKLVMGREGNRAWENEEEADKWLQGQKLKKDERYDYKLKSPTQIGKLLKEKLDKSTRSKNRYESLITRAPAKKVLALDDDKRPAVQADVSMMPDETEEFVI